MSETFRISRCRKFAPPTKSIVHLICSLFVCVSHFAFFYTIIPYYRKSDYPMNVSFTFLTCADGTGLKTTCKKCLKSAVECDESFLLPVVDIDANHLALRHNKKRQKSAKNPVVVSASLGLAVCGMHLQHRLDYSTILFSSLFFYSFFISCIYAYYSHEYIFLCCSGCILPS